MATATIIILLLVFLVGFYLLQQNRANFVSNKTVKMSTEFFSNQQKNSVPKYTDYKKAVDDADPIVFMDFFNSWKNENLI